VKAPPPAPGMLILDKPAGPTSRRLVDDVVRVLGTRRVGHAGTLDPFARGVLLVAWGKATAFVPYLQDYEKSYEAVVRFGRVTDTQDRLGETIEEHDASGLTAEAVEAALPGFRGEILQVPPMYSALKQNGRRLYELARRGETVDREPRRRRVSRLELAAWTPPVARLVVTCSSGTYVRTLAHDLGAALGPGASLDELTRTAVGPHRLEGAVAGDGVASLSREELLARAVPPAGVLPDWPAVVLPADETVAAASGSWRDPRDRIPGAGRYRLLDETGRLLALARGGEEPRLLRVFAERETVR
jgi:tRNA pseudouridine55 synthase